MKKLKVFGCRYLGSHWPDATRAVVATTSLTSAGKLIGVSYVEIHNFGRETKNEAETTWALDHPYEAWVFKDGRPVESIKIIADRLLAEFKSRMAKPVDPEALKKTFSVRMRESRVHELTVEAMDEEEAREIAQEMDASDSNRDEFDSWEFMDATEVQL